MSDERENDQAGAAVEQTEATETQVLAAVERAAEVPAAEGAPEAAPEGGVAAVTQNAEPVMSDEAERPKIAAFLEPPSATEEGSATEIFASNPPHTPTAAQPTAAPASGVLSPERDGEIRISADHPMAALYMQTPLPPEIKGNRGAGVLIALLATVAFALVYAGVLALWQAPNFPPSIFLNEGLLPWVLNWGFAAAVVGFFIGLSLLVLILGKAGWWSYVIFGVVVAAFVWAATVLGYALDARLAGEQISLHPYLLLVDFGLLFPMISAGIVAREVVVWFGAWIGARGRRVRRQNAEAIEAHEKAVAEAQAKQP